MGAVNIYGSPINKKKWKRYAKITDVLNGVFINSTGSVVRDLTGLGLTFEPRVILIIVKPLSNGTFSDWLSAKAKVGSDYSWSASQNWVSTPYIQSSISGVADTGQVVTKDSISYRVHNRMGSSMTINGTAEIYVFE